MYKAGKKERVFGAEEGFKDVSMCSSVRKNGGVGRFFSRCCVCEDVHYWVSGIDSGSKLKSEVAQTLCP